MITSIKKAKELLTLLQETGITPSQAFDNADIVIEQIMGSIYEFHYDSQSGEYEYWDDVRFELLKLKENED